MVGFDSPTGTVFSRIVYELEHVDTPFAFEYHNDARQRQVSDITSGDVSGIDHHHCHNKETPLRISSSSSSPPFYPVSVNFMVQQIVRTFHGNGNGNDDNRSSTDKSKPDILVPVAGASANTSATSDDEGVRNDFSLDPSYKCSKVVQERSKLLLELGSVWLLEPQQRQLSSTATSSSSFNGTVPSTWRRLTWSDQDFAVFLVGDKLEEGSPLCVSMKDKNANDTIRLSPCQRQVLRKIRRTSPTLRVHCRPARYPEAYKIRFPPSTFSPFASTVDSIPIIDFSTSLYAFPSKKQHPTTTGLAVVNNNTSHNHTGIEEDTTFQFKFRYEPEYGFLILNKPGGVPSHATVDNGTENALSRVIKFMAEQQQRQNGDNDVTSVSFMKKQNDDVDNGKNNKKTTDRINKQRFYIPTLPQRLDIETYGLLVIAMKKEFSTYFCKLLQEKSMSSLSSSSSSSSSSVVAKGERTSAPLTIPTTSSVSHSIPAAFSSSDLHKRYRCLVYLPYKKCNKRTQRERQHEGEDDYVHFDDEAKEGIAGDDGIDDEFAWVESYRHLCVLAERKQVVTHYLLVPKKESKISSKMSSVTTRAPTTGAVAPTMLNDTRKKTATAATSRKQKFVELKPTSSDHHSFLECHLRIYSVGKPYSIYSKIQQSKNNDRSCSMNGTTLNMSRKDKDEEIIYDNPRKNDTTDRLICVDDEMEHEHDGTGDDDGVNKNVNYVNVSRYEYPPLRLVDVLFNDTDVKYNDYMGNMDTEAARETQFGTGINLLPSDKEYAYIVELEIELLTGRPNQIRGQLAAMDCPIVGDVLYVSGRSGSRSEVKSPTSSSSSSSSYSCRMALQCYYLKFPKPVRPSHLVGSDNEHGSNNNNNNKNKNETKATNQDGDGGCDSGNDNGRNNSNEEKSKTKNRKQKKKTKHDYQWKPSSTECYEFFLDKAWWTKYLEQVNAVQVPKTISF